MPSKYQNKLQYLKFKKKFHYKQILGNKKNKNYQSGKQIELLILKLI